jgi:plasmid replication initiation protein
MKVFNMPKSNLVVKTNQLNSAVQNLSLPELRIIQLAIVDARETGKGLDTKTPLRIDAMRYAQAFDTTRQNAYILMKQSEETLFNRRFTYFDREKKPIKSRWLQDVRYLDDEGAIEVCFTRLVVECITRLDGAEQFFTQYMLSQTANLSSVYSVRLYELLIQWKTAVKTPVFELSLFRGQMGLNDDEYKDMSNFKKRVLDLAINEINEKTDLTVSYTQEKRGRTISGFKFTVRAKDVNNQRDPNTIDAFTGRTDTESKNIPSWQLKGLSDAQIKKIGVYKQEFIDANTSKISPNDRRGYDEIFESWEPLLKDPNQVKNFKIVQDLLERKRQN